MSRCLTAGVFASCKVMQSDLSHDLSPPSQTIYEKVAIIERELIRSTCRLKTHVAHDAVPNICTTEWHSPEPVKHDTIAFKWK